MGPPIKLTSDKLARKTDLITYVHKKIHKEMRLKKGSWSLHTILTGDWVGQSDTCGRTNESLKMKVKVNVKSLSHAQLFANPWIVAYQAPLSKGIKRAT